MVGENRIIAFGAGSSDASNEQASFETRDNIVLPAPQVTDPAPPAYEEPALEMAPQTAFDIEAEPLFREWVAPALAIGLAAGWTAIFAAAALPGLRSGVALPQIPALVAQWAVPVVLIGLVWLLAMRHSTRESRRFGNVARLLSSESALLETRLTTVNRELSLAREFIAAQSRDLEALGRMASDRLSQNADRLQELVRENGARVESISTVSSAALDNMEKLRGQLPVIASSAKDVTNNIANAGRTAIGQIEDMIQGFNRINEFGSACTKQIALLRGQVDETLAGFSRQCEQLEAIASARFAALDERTTVFRTELEKHETDALAAVRTRSAALTSEIEATRLKLDDHEAESLTSLRARLGALRDESDVVARALRASEERAAETLRQSIAAFSKEQTDASDQLSATQHAALDSLANRLATLVSETDRMDTALAERAARLALDANERLSRQAEQERYALARIEHMLGELDNSIAERLERHQEQAVTLGQTAGAVTAELGRFEASLGEIAHQADFSENSLRNSLHDLTERLNSARATLAVTDGEVEKLTGDSVRLLELIQASAKQTHTALPDALSSGEERLVRLQDGIAGVLALLRQSTDSGANLATGIEASGASLQSLISRLGDGHDALAQRGNDHAAALEDLRQSLADLDTATLATAGKARDELTAAIAALGETLAGAVAGIEDESATRIARMASTLGDESAAAIDKAMRGKVAEITGQLEQAVAHSAGVTREATVQLREQVSRVDDLVGNLETRVSQAREKAAEEVDNDFARRAALITESLNSNSIDIAAALSTDVSDTAWASYLRGDRGIFTRRAVRLLEAGDIKAIQQIFERDDAFRSQVSRYIHDFESILRQVLSTRDGNALGVTLLSSDMGKLYVALAQGIERLRN